MDPAGFIDNLCASKHYHGQVCHIETLPARPARYGKVAIEPAVQQILADAGIGRLYCHQAEAIGTLHDGGSVVIVTGTASGKTLCYNVPIIEAVRRDPLATALCIYPTKALTQDQLRGLAAFERPELDIQFTAGAYDGDTPQNARRKLRDAANVILTNPDMLHQGILPQHARWSRFFTHLKYVVIDEVHAYRGVFGSHLANVLRRLRRICAHYGAEPQFVCCSATIANPREHAERVTGVPMHLVDEDGSPRGPRHFVFWNPPPLDRAMIGPNDDWRVGGERRSSLWEAVHLLSDLVQEGIQTIAFVRTRLAAELIFKNCRDRLRPVSRRLADSVRAYRGGYLAEERRQIERQLVDREILGVASTNALELGIDIGSLDCCLLVGYPGAIASLWQRAGRAGRGQAPSLVFLIGQNTPMDQYLMAHSDYIFGNSPEHAVIDPDNPHVTVGHLKCACHELPLPDNDIEAFGVYSEDLLPLLEEERFVVHQGDQWYWSSAEYPAAGVSLRNIAGPVYTIQDETGPERVIGTLSEISALPQLHTHAVYLHAAETYFVNELDIEQKIARVEKRELDYYTQSVQVSKIRVDVREEEYAWQQALLGFGDVTVTTTIPMFKKIRFHSRDSLGYEELDLPPQELETVAMWLAPAPDIGRQLREAGKVVGEALIGIANVLVEVAPLFVMCDESDIGAVVSNECFQRDALFVHDRYPGGMGYARRCLECLPEMLETVRHVIADCACTDGCPSCVGAAQPAFAVSDLDSGVRNRIPDKAAALLLLDLLAGAPEALVG